MATRLNPYLELRRRWAPLPPLPPAVAAALRGGLLGQVAAAVVLLAMLGVVANGLLVQKDFLPGARRPEMLQLWWRVAVAGAVVWLASCPFGVDRAAPAALLPTRPLSWRSPIARTLLAASAALLVFGFGGIRADAVDETAAWYWLLGGIGLLAAFVVREAPNPITWLPAWVKRQTRWDWIGLANVALAFALRLMWPEWSPNFFNFDEAGTADWGLSGYHHWAVPGQTAIGALGPFQTNGYLETPNGGYYLYAVVMQLVGETIAGLHFFSAVTGAVTVWIVWLLLRDYVRPWAAVGGAFLLTVSHEHLFFSRNGMAIAPVVMIAMAVIWLVLRGLRGPGYLPFLIAGLLLGAGPNFYYSISAMGPILALFVGYMVLREGWAFVRTRWLHFLVLALGTIVTFGPLFLWYVGHPTSATLRASTVTFQGNDDYRGRMYPGLTTQQIFVEQAVRNLWGLAFAGDGTSQHYPIGEPLVDPATGALMLAGVVGFTLTARRPERFLLALYLWVPTLLIVFFTDRPPPMTRLIIVWPALCAMLGFLLDRLGGLAERAGGGPVLVSLALPLLLTLGYGTYWNYDRFFNLYPERLPADRWTLLAQVVNEAGTAVKSYSLGGVDLVFGKEHVHFLARRMVGETLDPNDAPKQLPIPELGWRGAQFYLMNDAQPLERQLRALYPGGTYERRVNHIGTVLFNTYRVDATTFHAAAPPNASWTQPDSTLGRIGKRWGEIYYPTSLTIDHDGDVYVADNGNGRVVKYSPEGEPLRQYGRPGPGQAAFSSVSAVGVAPNGEVVVLDGRTRFIHRFDQGGRWLGRFGGGAQLRLPINLVVGPDGTIVVADAGRPGLVRFAADGRLIAGIGAAGTGPGQFQSLAGLAGGADGTIYAIESDGRLQRFSPDLTLRDELRLPWGRPATQGVSLAVADADQGAIYAVVPGEGIIRRYSADGRSEWTIGRLPDGTPKFGRQIVTTTDARGNVYAMATESSLIYRFDVTKRPW